MIEFKGDSCYFVVPESKYGLSEIIPKYVTENNFTFCIGCKPDVNRLYTCTQFTVLSGGSNQTITNWAERRQ